VGSLFNVVFAVIYIPLAGLGTPAPSGALWGCSVVSSIAFPLAIGEAIQLEYTGEGAQFNNIDSSTFSPGYSVSSAMIMMVIDLFFYLILAWYLNAVVPADNIGRRLKPWFLFTPSYWFPPHEITDHNEVTPLLSRLPVTLPSFPAIYRYMYFFLTPPCY